MKKILLAMSICTCLLSSGTSFAEEALQEENIVSKHMVAQAILTAHYIDAALKAGMDTATISNVLASVAEQSVISEFWVSDEQGNIEFTNIVGTPFKFPTDPESDSQAAPFAALLSGVEPLSSRIHNRVNWMVRHSSTLASRGLTNNASFRLGYQFQR